MASFLVEVYFMWDMSISTWEYDVEANFPKIFMDPVCL